MWGRLLWLLVIYCPVLAMLLIMNILIEAPRLFSNLSGLRLRKITNSFTTTKMKKEPSGSFSKDYL